MWTTAEVEKSCEDSKLIENKQKPANHMYLKFANVSHHKLLLILDQIRMQQQKFWLYLSQQGLILLLVNLAFNLEKTEHEMSCF